VCKKLSIIIGSQNKEMYQDFIDSYECPDFVEMDQEEVDIMDSLEKVFRNAYEVAVGKCSPATPKNIEVID